MQNAFRRRFGNALQWYQVLEQRMKHEVESWVQALPSNHRDRAKPRDNAFMQTNTVPPADSTPTHHPAGTHDPFPPIQPSTTATEVVSNEETCSEITMIGKATANPSWHQPCPPKAFPLPSSDITRAHDRHAHEGRPSPYLIRRCPVCFSASGAKLDHSRYVTVIILALAYQKDYSAHAIVCLDANFSQCRRHSKYNDPNILHPDTYWVSPEDVKKMEAEVEAVRTGTKQQSANRTCTPTEVRDVPDQVYDDCQKTFIAAQNISKASNKIFADTVIMALVCRHDFPLLLVNMTSPGERQHYALALLNELFRQLPNDWHIGLLYDIACQLHRSMQKVCVILIKGG